MDGNLEITVNVHADGNLGEQMGNEDLVKSENFKELEETMASAIEEEIKSAVDKAQEWEVDIFKFGRRRVIYETQDPDLIDPIYHQFLPWLSPQIGCRQCYGENMLSGRFA